jgi:hypothetical protein
MFDQRLIKAIVLVTTSLLFQAAPAHAVIIASTLNAGQYSASGTVVSGSASSFGETDLAAPFTSSGNYSVDQIDVGLTHVFGTNSAVVGLWTDVGGIPTVELGSWNVSNQPAVGATSILTTITGISGINLTAGGLYFLTIFPGASDTEDVWNDNTLGILGLTFSLDGGTSWGQEDNVNRPAFDVLGNAAAVPEPATLSLFALLGLGAIARRRKSRKATRNGLCFYVGELLVPRE